MVKRSRIGTSSKLAGTDVINYDQHRNVGRHGYGGFLEKCFYCSSRIFGDMEVFTYSEHAFCTPLCRESQIIVDKGKEKQTRKRKVSD